MKDTAAPWPSRRAGRVGLAVLNQQFAAHVGSRTADVHARDRAVPAHKVRNQAQLEPSSGIHGWMDECLFQVQYCYGQQLKSGGMQVRN